MSLLTEDHIYSCTDISDFLSWVVVSKKEKNPLYSVRAWSRQLGYKSPSLLINVLQGKRSISAELETRIADSLDLKDRKRKYFGTLCLVSRAKSDEDKKLFLTQLGHLRPDQTRSQLKLAQFRLIQDWYYLAILELAGLPDFVNDPSFITRRLRQKVSIEQVNMAMKRLLKLGLLLPSLDGRLTRTRGNPVIRDEVPSEAVRNHHRQMLALARDALREQTLEERDFRATKVAISRSDLPKLKNALKEFHQTIQRLSMGSSPEHIFALNTQLFKLTGEISS